jgi:nitroimidazol reductase NimA-like FMN-containing flavoprotein (pyridoxamine 5'-phosphate oxidase superfamily)
MSTYDEPPIEPSRIQDAEPRALRAQIRALIDGQPFAVLCTQGGGQPYGSLVAYAASDDLLAATFATPVATRKYRLLCECQQVALVVDSRSQHSDALMQVEAITATGRATQLQPGPAFDHWAALLIARHPRLKSFVAAPSSALFRIDMVRYLYVARFQEVRQWIPNRSPPRRSA